MLILGGLRVLSDGRVAKAKQARTLDEAAATLANRLQAELRCRGTHPEVLRCCREELLRNSGFRAVFEATKGLAQRLRDMTALDADGAALIDTAFALGEHDSPRVRINALSMETERSEHKGFANLIKGVFGLFRNVAAHARRAVWAVSEEDALDLFTTLCSSIGASTGPTSREIGTLTGGGDPRYGGNHLDNWIVGAPDEFSEPDVHYADLTVAPRHRDEDFAPWREKPVSKEAVGQRPMRSLPRRAFRGGLGVGVRLHSDRRAHPAGFMASGLEPMNVWGGVGWSACSARMSAFDGVRRGGVRRMTGS